MKGYTKFYDAIKDIDLTDEKAVWTALNKSGLYSKSQIFQPLTILSMTFVCKSSKSLSKIFSSLIILNF